jgi:hypothetical protein
MHRSLSIGTRTCSILLIVAATGCAAATNSDALQEQGSFAGRASDELGVISQSLDSSWVAGPYKVAGNQAVAMNAISTHVCVLTRVAGSFQGWGESVGVWPNSVQWNLSSVTQQPGVSAEAHCFAISKFLGPSYRAHFHGVASQGVCGDGMGGCASGTSRVTNGTQTVFINGINGTVRRPSSRVPPAPRGS